jgi:hypothetical protein
MEVSGQLHAPAALLPGKEPLVSFDRRLGWPQSHSGGGGEEKNPQPSQINCAVDINVGSFVTRSCLFLNLSKENAQYFFGLI